MTKKHWRSAIVVVAAMIVLGSLLGLSDAFGSHHPREKVRIFAGPNPNGGLLWTIERIPFRTEPAWWIFIGSSSYYPPAYTFTEHRLYEGSGFYGPILFTFSRKRVYQGPSILGPILFNLTGNRLFEGPNTTGRILYNFTGKRVFEGPNTTGEILLNTTINISSFSGPLEFVLGILLTEQLPELPVTPTPPPPPPPPL